MKTTANQKDTPEREGDSQPEESAISTATDRAKSKEKTEQQNQGTKRHRDTNETTCERT